MAFSDWRLPFLMILRKVRPIWPTSYGNRESRRIAPWRGHEGRIPLEALHSFVSALGLVRRDLGKVNAPLLAIHAVSDRSVPPGQCLGDRQSGVFPKSDEWNS